MPEFHKNQIAWDAPASGGVKLAKPDYGYLQDAMNSLADKANRVANAEMIRLDDSIKADLDAELESINADLDNMRSATGDFDGMENAAISRLHGVLANYDEATRRRFLNKNPHYLDNVRLATKEKILDRKRDIYETEVENNLPLWTSQAAMIGTPEARQEVIHKIQQSLGNISYESTVSNMIYKANQMFDNYNVQRLIGRGDKESLLAAKEFLRSPETSVTIDPYTRARLDASIDKELTELAKPKKKEDNPYAIAIEQAVADLALEGRWDEVDFIKDQITNSGDSIKTSRGNTANMVNGVPLPLYLSMGGLTSVERFALRKDLDNKYKSPAAEQDQIEYNMAVSDTLTDYVSGFDNKTTEASRAVLGLREAMNDDKFEKLDKTTKEDVERAVKQYTDAKTELMTSDSMPFRRGAFYNYRSESEEKLRSMLKTQIDMISKQGGRELLFVDGRTAPSIAEKFDTRTGPTLRDAIAPMRETYYKDIENNTVGEYTLMLWKQLSVMQAAGMLKGTGFEASQDTYTTFFDSMLGDLSLRGTVNTETSEETVKDFRNVLKGMLGTGATVSQKEQDIIDVLINNASSAQKGMSSGWFWDALDWIHRKATGERHVVIPTNAKPNPKLTTLEVAQNMSPNIKQTRKAIKETK